MKDDSGSNAAFPEQGSSASKDGRRRNGCRSKAPPGCAGQAAAAVPAYTQVKMEDAPGLLKLPKSECPDVWIRLPRHTWPKSWSNNQDPEVPLERNSVWTPICRPLVERDNFEKVLLRRGWVQSTELGMLVRAPKARSISVRIRGCHKRWLEGNQNLNF